MVTEGQANCLKVLVHRKFFLPHIKEQIMHKDLCKATTVLIQYTCINSLKTSMKPDNSVYPDQLASSEAS